MSAQELEGEVERLSADELATFTKWFEEFVATAWDRRLEDDVAAGRLGKLGDEALADLHEGRTTRL